jgi:hypothetical protein
VRSESIGALNRHPVRGIAYHRGMLKLVTIVGFVVLAACSKRTLGDNILEEYTRMKDNLCACTTKDCVDGSKAQADAIEERARQDIKNPSKELEQKFENVEKQINECARKFQ